MSDLFYRAIRFVGTQVFRLASVPRVLHAERAARRGAYLLASNHSSLYDAPLIIASNPRVIYWLSIVEIFRQPLARWFLTRFGAMPLDRSRADTQTVRKAVRHLRAGHVVGIFPEGAVRKGPDSVLTGGGLHDGVCKLAQLAGVPVLPCVVLGGGNFARWPRWLPGARTPWTVIFGEPILLDRAESGPAMADRIAAALRTLHQEALANV